MFSLTPTGTPAETASAFGLFAILADPEAAKARLDALAAEKQASLAARDEAASLLAQAKESRDAAQAIAAEARATAARNATQDANLSERERMIVSRDKEIAVRETDHKAMASKFEATSSARDADLNSREKQIVEDEKRLASLLKEAEDLKALHQSRVDALRSALTTAS